jgi:hypothetical protein
LPQGIRVQISAATPSTSKEKKMADKGKSSKAGRQKKCGQNLAYINEQRHDKSHVRRLVRHCERFMTDKIAAASLVWYRARLGQRRAA